MTTTYTLTGDFADILGATPRTRSVRVLLETNLGDEALVDLDTNEVRLSGPTTITLDDNMAFSLTLIATNSTGINVTDGSLRYRVTAHYVGADRRARTWDSGYFALTADTDLSDVVSEAFLPPTFASAAIAQVQALVDEAELITGLTGEDAAMAVLANDPDSEFYAAIDSRFSGVVASDPAVVDAAETAVDTYMATGPKVMTYDGDLGTDDLNTRTTSGFFRQATAANATLARNYPLADEPGVLEVTTAGNEMRVQRYYPAWGNSQGRVIWQRTRTTAAAGWSSWYAFAARRVTSSLGKIEVWDDVQKRWQLDATSDTGWRTMSTTFLNGWTGILHLRRRGYVVSARFRNIAAGTAATLCAVPTGFETNQSGTAQFALQTSSPAWPATVSISGSIVLSTGLTLPDVFQEVSWGTTAAWPAALPGAALGTIPNA